MKVDRRRALAGIAGVVAAHPSFTPNTISELVAAAKKEPGRIKTGALAQQAQLFDEFLAREADRGALKLALEPQKKRALLHGRCHQKAFGAMPAVERVLKLIPLLQAETIE